MKSPSFAVAFSAVILFAIFLTLGIFLMGLVAWMAFAFTSWAFGFPWLYIEFGQVWSLGIATALWGWLWRLATGDWASKPGNEIKSFVKK